MVSSWGVGWRFVHPIVLLKRPRPNEAEGSPEANTGIDVSRAATFVRLNPKHSELEN